MSWSLNEIEALTRKAARGSGLSWGLSEEAGKSARWLAGAGLPGPALLADLLTQNDGAAYDTLCPANTTGRWSAANGVLCPLIAGAVICDHATEIANGRDIQLGRTSYPLLLVPYAAAAADMTGKSIAVTWDGVTLILGDDTRIDTPSPAAATAAQAERVDIRLAGTETGQPLPLSHRGDMSAQTAKTLNAFAHRTYAPDTPESRLAGAGAGLTDND